MGFANSKIRSKHAARMDRIKIKKRLLINSVDYKKRRLLLKKKRTALRHAKEGNEGTTYNSGCALEEPAANNVAFDEHDLVLEGLKIDVNPIVYVDLETGGFSPDCDILQIAAIHGTEKFSCYVTPTKPIMPKASEVTGLTCNYGQLFFHSTLVDTVSLRVAMGEFHKWLLSLREKPYIVTHNLTFDGPRLLKAIDFSNLNYDFQEIVLGFVDSVPVIRTVTGRSGKGNETTKLTGLAEWLKISSHGAHDAERDVDVLQKIVHKLKIIGCFNFFETIS